MAFSGWPETRTLLSLQQIANVEKQSLFFVPNAILVTTNVGEDYFFGSFLDRDLCYSMLTAMILIAKSLLAVEVGGHPNSLIELNTSMNTSINYRNSTGRIKEYSSSHPERSVTDSIMKKSDVQHGEVSKRGVMGVTLPTYLSVIYYEHIKHQEFNPLHLISSVCKDTVDLYQKNEITLLKDIPCRNSLLDVWRVCWLHSSHYQ